MSENVIAGATPKTSIKKYWVDGIIPWMASGEIHKKRVYNTEKYITVEGFKNSSTKMIPINSVLIALAGQGKTRGTVAINKIKLCTNQSIASIVPNDKLNYNFLYYYLGKNYNKIRSLSNADSGKGGLNLSIIRSFSIILPEIKEQEKIGNFLFTFDEKINLLNDKLRIFCEFKRYLLQNLFPKSGELAPKLRFKNENKENYSTWDKNFLGELCEITTGKLNANAMVKSGKYRFYTCAETYYYTNEYTFDTEALLIAGNGNVGIIHYYKGKFNAYQRTYVLYNFKCCIKYIKYYLEKFLKRRIFSEKNVGCMPYIKLSTLDKMIIRLAPQNEQIKIANFLSLVDKKIDLIQDQIEKTKEFKKGLLQQMFEFLLFEFLFLIFYKYLYDSNPIVYLCANFRFISNLIMNLKFQLIIFFPIDLKTYMKIK